MVTFEGKTFASWQEARASIVAKPEAPPVQAVAIEQKDFGVIAEVVNLEGESVFRILRAMNSYADMLHSLKMLRGVRDWAKEHNKITILQCCDWSLIDAAIAKAERGHNGHF
jgi:uncharacterized heparinase superfamily protein